MEDVVQRIEQPIEELVKTQKAYWVNVLYRVVDVLKLLCSQGLSLKAINYDFVSDDDDVNYDDYDDEDEDEDEDNYGTLDNGNFIGYLKLLSKFDVFLNKHIKEFSNENEGSHCFSPTTFKELIEMMEQKVYNAVIEEVKTAKYFSIIIDTTPYTNSYPNIEPSFIFRYVQNDGKQVERFLCFLKNTDNNTEDLVNEVFDIIRANNLNIEDCRGLGYDPTSHMLDTYLSLQTRIKESCMYADYIPYSAHSLNFACERSVKCQYYYKCSFLIENLFKFFSTSTYHWQVLVECSIENVSNKDWINHNDTWHALSENWTEVTKALYTFFNGEIKNVRSSYEAGKLLDELKSLEICIIVSFWSDVLKQINLASETLEEITIDLMSIISAYSSLIQYISDLKDKFDYYETKCIEKSGINEYSIENWNNWGRKKKSYDCELEHNLKETFKTQVFIPILNSVITELNKRKLAYVEMNNKFGFFFHLAEMTPSEVKDKAKSLQNYYFNDLSIQNFSKECVELLRFLTNLSTNFPKTILEIYQKLQEIEVQDIFPEVNIALRMFLCSPASYSSKQLNNFHVVFNRDIDDDNNYDLHDYDFHESDDNDYDSHGSDDTDYDFNENDDYDFVFHESDNDYNFHESDDNDDDSDDIVDNSNDNEMNVLERIQTYLKSRKINVHYDQDYQPILTIEGDLTKSLNYDDIIQQFSQSLLEHYGN